MNGVRVEWNYSRGLDLYNSGSLTINGGLFDRNYGCGINLNVATAVQVSGTEFHRNGRNNDFTYLSNAQ